ncbi:MAG: formate dehydrogenase accessory sulfurtransferase FdhD [Rhodanobacter sp.]|nr:formate dehydrogenase accessory sulfurtransferase FdhD [Rhodanobacter sp.]
MIKHELAMAQDGFVSRPIDRWRQGKSTHEDDCVAEEVPVAVVCNGVSFAVMMATPHDLEDFALGFALSEGLIGEPAQLLGVQACALLEGIELALQVAEDTHGAHLDRAHERRLPGRSGCGICGTRELEQAIRHNPPVGAGSRVTHEAIDQALAELQTRQPMNAATGAVHAAAWADRHGHVTLVREDVGRHNALDKLIGAMHCSGLDANDGMAVVTSRASYEMVTKAAGAGITVLAAISAPTALAIELAHSAGVTLVGFTRPGSHNVYSHPQRLLPEPWQDPT